MSEHKEKESGLVENLISHGYEPAAAQKAVDDVFRARREEREKRIKQYVGMRRRAEFGGLLFEVIIKDVKIDNFGKVQFQVTPLNGTKCVWVDHLTTD